MNCFLLIGLSLLRGPPPLATTPPSLLSFPDENECQKDLHLEGGGGKGRIVILQREEGSDPNATRHPGIKLKQGGSEEDEEEEEEEEK